MRATFGYDAFGRQTDQIDYRATPPLTPAGA